ncbi:MAG: hypothetical protein EA339_12350 [Rhodobacteraceae bacterium]|nr:MAG: hypothetical protein EA339_12350 [Paracoccaceae bacterium]
MIWAAPWLLVACFAPSDLPPAKSGAAEPTPALLPLSQVLSLAAEGPRSAQLSAPPDARIAALRARADALRGPVIAPSERQRIEAARRRLD